ncbi:MAG: hypothetical protein KF788_08855 [Piscinibacter sp.]|nr:hypothetical protein [Piscinibacter sp.]
MKKVEILAPCFAPSEVEGQMKTLYPESVLEVDDNTAIALVASQRAKFADKGAKLRDTTKEHEAAAEKARAEQLTPQAVIAAAVAAAVKAVMQPAEAAKA